MHKDILMMEACRLRGHKLRDKNKKKYKTEKKKKASNNTPLTKPNERSALLKLNKQVKNKISKNIARDVK